MATESYDEQNKIWQSILHKDYGSEQEFLNHVQPLLQNDGWPELRNVIERGYLREAEVRHLPHGLVRMVWKHWCTYFDKTCVVILASGLTMVLSEPSVLMKVDEDQLKALGWRVKDTPAAYGAHVRGVIKSSDPVLIEKALQEILALLNRPLGTYTFPPVHTRYERLMGTDFGVGLDRGLAC